MESDIAADPIGVARLSADRVVSDAQNLPDLIHQFELSGHEHKYDDVCGQGFLAQARRERRAYPPAVCKERTTKPAPKRPAALRVAPNLACGFVARRLQPLADAPSSRLATGQIGR